MSSGVSVHGVLGGMCPGGKCPGVHVRGGGGNPVLSPPCIIFGKGVYPQSNKSLALVDIDASKGIIDLWVHFFVAIEDIH